MKHVTLALLLLIIPLSGLHAASTRRAKSRPAGASAPAVAPASVTELSWDISLLYELKRLTLTREQIDAILGVYQAHSELWTARLAPETLKPLTDLRAALLRGAEVPAAQFQAATARLGQVMQPVSPGPANKIVPEIIGKLSPYQRALLGTSGPRPGVPAALPQQQALLMWLSSHTADDEKAWPAQREAAARLLAIGAGDPESAPYKKLVGVLTPMLDEWHKLDEAALAKQAGDIFKKLQAAVPARSLTLLEALDMPENARIGFAGQLFMHPRSIQLLREMSAARR